MIVSRGPSVRLSVRSLCVWTRPTAWLCPPTQHSLLTHWPPQRPTFRLDVPVSVWGVVWGGGGTGREGGHAHGPTPF